MKHEKDREEGFSSDLQDEEAGLYSRVHYVRRLKEKREEEKGEVGPERDGVERNVSSCLQGEEREVGKVEEGLEGEEEGRVWEGVEGDEERQVAVDMTVNSRR